MKRGKIDALGVDWAALRFPPTAAIRSKLADRDNAGGSVIIKTDPTVAEFSLIL